MSRIIYMLFFMFLCSCTGLEWNNDKDIEKEIRDVVAKDGTYIASLEASYLITFLDYHDGFLSDDFYIQKDKVSFDYGFKIDIDKNIKIIRKNGQRILQVTLPKGEPYARGKITLDQQKTDGYIPKRDIDKEVAKESEKIQKDYEKQHLKYAKDNIKNFFRVLAQKYDLELELLDG